MTANEVQTAVERAVASGGGYGKMSVAVSTEADSAGFWRVLVTPVVHPGRDLVGFLGFLAEAQVALWDEGFQVNLRSGARQPLVVLANVVGEPTPYLFLSSDGREYQDLAALLGRSESELKWVEIQGYPFDSEEEKRLGIEALTESAPNLTWLGEKPAAA